MLLRPDGTPDFTFAAGSGPDDVPLLLIEQPDGQVLMAGRFASVDGAGSPRLVRLRIPPAQPPVPAHLVMQPVTTGSTNATGSLVLRAAGVGTPPLQWRWHRNGRPLTGADGFPGWDTAELVIPAAFAREAAVYQAEIANASGRERSALVAAGLASGTWETRFTTNLLTGSLRMTGSPLSPLRITGLAADRNAGGVARRILITGTFDTYDGTAVPGLVVVFPDGVRDSGWSPPPGISGAETVAATFRPDGGLVLAGRYRRSAGAPRDMVIRLKADGSLDDTFDPGDELAVNPPPGFPRQTSVQSLALDGDAVFLASAASAEAPNGFVRRLDSAGKTDLSFAATNVHFTGIPNVLSTEPGEDGGVLVGGSSFAAQPLRGQQTLFRGVARLLRDGRLDTNFNADPRRPDNSANGDVTAVLPLPEGPIWVAGNFAELDSAPGPLVRLDPVGKADPDFAVWLPSDPPSVFPGRNLLGASLRPDGGLLLNFRPLSGGPDGIVAMRATGEVQATAGGAVEALRSSGPGLPGPVLDLGDGSYLTPIQVRASAFGAASAAVGRFWLTPLAARPSAQLPPILLGGPEIQVLTHRAGFSEPLVLSVATQAAGAVTIRWYRNDVLLESETDPLLRIAHPEPGHSGRYRVEVSNDAGRAAAEAEVTIVPVPPEAPRLQASWTDGARPIRLTFLPTAGRTYRLESSDALREWRPVEDPEMVVGSGDFALPASALPSFYRLVEEP